MANSHSEANKTPSLFKKYKVPAILTLLILLTALPLTLTLVKQRQDIRQHAEADGPFDTLDYFIPKDTSKGLNSVSYIVTTDNKAYVDFHNDYQIYSWDNDNIYFLEEWRHNIPTPAIIQMKRHMSVNDTFTQTVMLTQFEKDTCNQLPTQAPFTDNVTLYQHLPTFNAGGDVGTVDTIVMKYDYVTRYELFYYAKGYGLVQWEKYNPDGSLYQATAHYNTFTAFNARDCSIACSPTLQTCSPLPTPTTGTVTATPTATVTPGGNGVLDFIKGDMETASCTQVSGWACDTRSPSKALPITLGAWDLTSTLSGQMIDIGNPTSDAGGVREAAIASQCGGNTNHGYSFSLPDKLKDGKQHYIGTSTSDTSVFFGPVLPITCNAASVANCTAQFQMNVPHADSGDDVPVKLTVFDNNTPGDFVLSTNAKRGKVDNNTVYTLNYTLPKSLADGKQHQLLAESNLFDGGQFVIKDVEMTAEACQNTGVQTPTPTPTGTLTPSPTPTPADTVLKVSLFLDGIGKTGTTNASPQHGSRNIHLEVFDTNNMFVTSRDGVVNFDSSTGAFTGNFDVATLSSGNYFLHFAVNQYLVQIQTTPVTVTAGQSNMIPPVTLTGGDIIWDNQIDMLDYNALLSCYSDTMPAKSCTDAQKLQADINDDGKVDGLDYNLFLRELKKQ